MLFPLSCLLAFSTITTSVRGELYGGCNPLPEPNLVNQFLRTKHSDLKNPAFGESVNGLTAESGLRFPRQLQVVKCHSLGNSLVGNSSFEFYQVESPGQVCKAPPPLDCDVSPHVRSELKGPGGLLFLAFLISVIVTGFTTWVVIFALGEFIVTRIGRLAYWLRGKLCGSPQTEADNGPSILEEGSTRGAFYVQANGVWSLGIYAQRAADDPLSESHSATWDTGFGGSGSPYDLSFPRPNRTASQGTSASNRTCAFLKGLAEVCACILAYAGLFGVIGFITVAMLCQTSVNDVTPCKGPSGLPDPAAGLNRFLTDSGTGLNLTLCATKTMNFYVSCPVNCTGLGEPYGDRAPVKALLRVCPTLDGHL